MFNPNPRQSRRTLQQLHERRLMTSWFQPSNETIREQELILSNMYFLVLQGDTFGERLKCVECGGRHKYITLRCIEKPITGLTNGLYAYYRVVRDNNLENELNPGQRARFQEIQRTLSLMPDLSKVHPQLARQFAKDVGPSDLQLGALSLGILEGISPVEARRLVDKINEKGLKPPYRLSTVTQAEVDRALEYSGPPRFSRSRW